MTQLATTYDALFRALTYARVTSTPPSDARMNSGWKEFPFPAALVRPHYN